jgi:hypothetical protein
MYYVSKGSVWSMKRGGGDKRDEGVPVSAEKGYLYFVDGKGEVGRAKRKGA